MAAARRPLVLIPGILCTPRVFQPMLNEMKRIENDSSRHRDLPMVVDVRRSGWTTVDGLAADLLRDVLPEHFSLAGLSFGGYVALSILRQAPERVERLALIASQARSDSSTTRQQRKRLVTLAKQLASMNGVMDLLGPMLVHPLSQGGRGTGSEARSPSAEDHLAVAREMAHETGIRAFALQQAAASNRRDQSDLLPRLALPTLVVSGRQDGVIPFAAQQAVASTAAASSPALVHADHIPIGKPRKSASRPQPLRGFVDTFELRFRQLSPCGHLSPIEQPAAVARELLEWMELQPAAVTRGGSALLPA